MQKYLIAAMNTPNVLQLLRDPIWQSVGVVIAVIIGFVSIILTLKQRKCKRLSYSVLPQTQLVRGDKDLVGLLEITFKGKPVRSLYAVYVEICNSGNTAILPGDYEEPIAINFTKDVQLLSADIVSRRPGNLKIAANVQQSRVVISSTLLNADDTFLLKVLVDKSEVPTKFSEGSDAPVPLSVSGRVVDVKDIYEVVVQSKSRSISNLFGSVRFPLIFLRRKNRSARADVGVTSCVSLIHQPPSNEKEHRPEKLENIVVQKVRAIDAEKESVPDISTCPIPTWEELPEDQKMPYYTSAVQWLKDEGVVAPRPLAIENVAKGLWYKEHQVKLGIKAEFMAAKARNKGRDVSEDIKKALRRLPEVDTKD